MKNALVKMVQRIMKWKRIVEMMKAMKKMINIWWNLLVRD
jgi:hypothetical protein